MYSGIYTILQEVFNRFLCLLIVFLESKTHELIKLEGLESAKIHGINYR